MSLATLFYEGTLGLGQESDDIVSLPAPPPPNPAARRSAIDTALRKFDGIEEPPRARPGVFGWASSHRRLTGGLVTAALVAVVGIPAMQIAIRNQPAEVASERAGPGLATADVEPVEDNAAIVANEPPPETATPVPMARNEPVAAPAQAPAKAKEERLGFAASAPEPKARAATIAPMLSAPAPVSPMAVIIPAPPPPPPPPPPPSAPPMAESEAADAVAAESGSIVVTGQAARRQNMKSAAPATAQDAEADFDQKLRSAFQSNNRAAILRLIGFPLKVDFNGDVRTYRTRSEVERDFDRIFTGEVRGAVLGGQAGRHLSFAPGSGGAFKIKAVRP